MRTFSVCIPSIGRSSLLHTIESIGRCRLPEGTSVEIVVGDDSADGAATRVIDAGRGAASGANWPEISCVHVASKNISTARNECLQKASGDYIVFIDDDEWANPELLLALHRTAVEHGADAVFGAVKAIYPKSAPKWCHDLAPYDRHVPPTGSVVRTGATSIVLIRRATVERLQLAFDPELGRTGGEDTQFFDAMSRAGCKLVTSQEAVVFENVPLERLQTAYLLRRYMRGGQSFARTQTAHAKLSRRAVFAAGTIAKAASCSVMGLAMWPIDRSRSIAWQIQLAGHVGKIRQLLGLPLSRIY